MKQTNLKLLAAKRAELKALQGEISGLESEVIAECAVMTDDKGKQHLVHKKTGEQVWRIDNTAPKVSVPVGGAAATCWRKLAAKLNGSLPEFCTVNASAVSKSPQAQAVVAECGFVFGKPGERMVWVFGKEAK